MWIVCQIGAREHYAIPRALDQAGALAGLITDFWVKPGSAFGRIPGGRRLADRYHPKLAAAKVFAPNARMLGFELKQRLAKRRGWSVMMKRNQVFQKMACGKLSSLFPAPCPLTPDPCLFSYSYAARDLFRFAKSRGWTTVLGQIDPGPEEERIVAAEHQRYPELGSSWQPAPSEYWESWREELELADRIIVNSEWSRQCLLKEGVPDTKLEVVPLVYGDGRAGPPGPPTRRQRRENASETMSAPSLRLLFLGQVILRKGVGRLLEAMRLLKDDPVELILAGPSEIEPTAWADLPNVRWVGPVPRSEVDRVYQDADLFILPTLSDGYALTQLESLSHGLPVIASKHCGNAVTDGVNGWILADLEPETIAACLRRAMSERLQNVKPLEFGLNDLAAALANSSR